MGLILVNQNYLLFYTAVISHLTFMKNNTTHFSVVLLCVNRIHKNLYFLFISSLSPRQKVDYRYRNSY